METLALASVGGSTQKVYWNQWQTWCRLRALEGKGAWLLERDGVDAAVKELTKFMALRCFSFKNQSQTVRGYLAAIKYFHRMFEGWELPTSHCMVTAVGKGIDRAHGKSEVRPKVRKPLSWELLTKGRGCVAGGETEGWVVWYGLALSFHLLCRASEIWAFGNGLVHPDFCLTRRDLEFFAGASQLAWDDRRIADRVEVKFRASKSDNKRLGATVTRTSVPVGKDQGTGGVRGYGALEIILDLLDLYPELSGSAPLMQTRTASGWKVISRAVATKALRRMVSSLGRDPAQYALHSGRIGGATQLAAQGASDIQIQRAGRWKSLAFMVYVRAGGEGAEFVSEALSR